VQGRRQLEHMRVREQAERSHRGVDIQTRGKAGAYCNGQNLLLAQVEMQGGKGAKNGKAAETGGLP